MFKSTSRYGCFAIALLFAHAPWALGVESIIIFRAAGLTGTPPEGSLAYIGTGHPSNVNTMPSEVEVTGAEGGPYTITFKSGLVDYVPGPASLHTLYLISTSTTDIVWVSVRSTGTSGKDIGIQFDGDASGDPAHIRRLDVDLTACRSSQIVDSEIASSAIQLKLKHDPTGPANAGRCELKLGSIPATASTIACYDYNLEISGAFNVPIVCNGDLSGFIRVVSDSVIDSNIIINGNLQGEITLPVMEGDITAKNFTSASTLTLDEMYGEIKADDGAGGGNIEGTINCTGEWSQFVGKITPLKDITNSSNITIDFIDSAAQIEAAGDFAGNLTSLVSAGTIGAIGDLTARLVLTQMDGNLIGDNLSASSCINEELAPGSDVKWNFLAPGGTINGVTVNDTVPIDGTQDECQIIPLGLVGDTDGDGILDDGDLSGVIGDNPCKSGQTLNCDDNSPMYANSAQTNSDGDSIGDGPEDNCLDVTNDTNCDTQESFSDNTGDSCDTCPGTFSTLADRDGDCDVDGVDFAVFAACFNKAGNPPRTLGCNSHSAKSFDFDDDGDVDGVDFSVFAPCFNKAGNPPRTPGCIGAGRQPFPPQP